ncbi:hypothetical protein B0T26DRAFT_836721 [Lasiosphaeria miniovina]|uniref:Uncharacterized protein n=1 Tax=Lasiosphaeria miniovina TaxID=1954250 RepID=A0AA40DLR0_9PEZI|nr:uncharacterized protein B0T26DRAFT_836721 [Lasiosphaeria miniovina]KAK0705906.1 hypothetical protein B0T26DRAFT_836721 [Lasiosphaeria miniovina]
MADPLIIVGTAGAVTGLVEALGRIIEAVSALRSQWKDANLIALAFETQLVAMRAALAKIEQWASIASEPHHQLVIDLGRCVSCCRLLVDKLDVEVARFTNLGGALNTSDKLQLIFKSKGLQHVQKSIEIQTTALTLLLTACNSNTLAEQSALLQRPSPRKTFKKMEADAASIIVLRDVDSILSGYTATSINSSKRSLVFEFDQDLLTSRIYQKWIRGSVRGSLLKQQGTTQTRPPGPALKLLSDRALRYSCGYYSCPFLITGTETPPTMDMLKRMKAKFPRIYTKRDEVRNRALVLSAVIASARSVARALLKLFDVELGIQHGIEYTDLLFLENFGSGSTQGLTFDSRFPNAVESLRKCNCFQRLEDAQVEAPEDVYPCIESAEYLFLEVRRIWRPDYIPNDLDIFRCGSKPKWAGQTALQIRITLDKHFLTIYDIPFEVFDMNYPPNPIIFVVDLDHYDRPNVAKALDFLRDDAARRSNFWRHGKEVMIVLYNSILFRSKLAAVPLSKTFPDYTGGSDVDQAFAYLLETFSAFGGPYYTCKFDPTNPTGDEEVLLHIKFFISEAINKKILRDSGFL